MAIQRFENLIAWQKAQDLAVVVHESFSELKNFSLRDQLFRSAESISNIIAEGFDRSSKADFSRFLYISLASCSELRSMLYLAERLKFVSHEKNLSLLSQADEVSKIIRGLIKSLKIK